jgi:arabinan endo-1,5-alpha-L-arabinosidase
MNLSRRQFIGFAGATAASSITPRFLFADVAPANPTFTVGEFKKIYDASVGEKEAWYINDHTFIRAEDGQWHLFGITHRGQVSSGDEEFFAHATAPDLMGPWTKQARTLHADSQKQETFVWAPYAFRHDGLYYMYYCAGGSDHAKYQIHLATSKDLWTWERSPANPMVVDGFDARDPMVLQVDGQWVLYYCATSAPQGGNHTVKAVTSRDLLHWSDAREVFRSPEMGSSGGPTESPFVVARNGKFYLFVCTNNPYNDTAAYVSDSPFHWDMANQVGKFPAHAAEIVVTPEGKWFASRAGWGQGGVYLAELDWKR